MTSSGDNRSINVGSSVKNSSLLTGDHATVTHVTLPPPSTVDPKAQLAALRDLLAGLNVPERRRLDNALQEADDLNVGHKYRRLSQYDDPNTQTVERGERGADFA